MAINAHHVITAVAVRYLDAARVLHKNSPAPNALWEPQNHLFAMAAELALKAFLERAGVSEGELKRQSVRHSLNGLLLLAIGKGLRTSYEVAEVLMEMDEAHSSHAYRYVPRPEEGAVITVHSARPANAYSAIQRLLDQCAADPSIIRTQTQFPQEWPPALLPVHPVTNRQLQEWVAEKQRLREQTWPFDPTWSFFVAGFVRDPEGKLTREFGPQRVPSEEAASDTARGLIRSDYAGVIAWRSRRAAGDGGEPPEVLYQFGEVQLPE